MNNRRDISTQAYIVNLEHNGNQLCMVIKDIIKDRPSRDEKILLIDRIYKELVHQAVIPMRDDFCDYSLTLLSLPDYVYFADVPELFNVDNANKLTLAFREFALSLVILLRNRIGNGVLYEYLLDEVTRNYIIVTKLQGITNNV